MGCVHLVAGRLTAIIAVLAACACSSKPSTTATGPTGIGHDQHLQSGIRPAGGACSDCHAPSGFTVDFSQDPMVRTSGGAFDPATKNCSNVYCHGAFTFGSVKGADAVVHWGDPGPTTCVSCHGMPPTGHPQLTGSVTAATCATCHPASVNPDGTIKAGGTHLNGLAETAAAGCTGCHGDATRTGNVPGTDPNLASSPPVAPTGSPAYATGAHLGHVNPTTASSLMPPIACAECHVVPTDSTHATNPPAQLVVFGSVSRTGGAAPTWSPTTAGCSASYCHGNFNYAGVTGANATPLWTDSPFTDCTACHGMPPAGHAALPSPVTASSCASCHPSSVNADGSINRVAGGHLNGRADTAALGCTACHGDATRTGNLPGTDVNLASSPPVAPAGAPAFATGAHLGHVNPTAASFLMAPIACAECHSVPTDSAHATSPPPQIVVFGAMSRTGAAAPTWTSTTTGCAATYCHGNFSFNGVKGTVATPLWTDAPFTDCTPCHGMPPTGHLAVAAPVTPASCAACHPDTVNADGTINQAKGAHMNGRADVNNLACTTCHGDASRTPNLAGTDPNLTSAPPVAPTGSPAYAVGAHLGHLNPTAASYLMPPIACAECHPVPTDQAHATNPPAQIVVFGTTSRTGGAAPTFDPTTSGCAATYCHGNFTLGAVSGNKTAAPLWTDGPTTCISCHGMIPTGHPAYTATAGYTAASCFQCHPQSVNADGTIKQGGGHLTGKADGGGCSSCHGDPPATGRHTEEDHVRLRCDACHPTGYTSTTTVAAFHENGVVDLGAQAGYSCGLKGCPTGVRGTCTNACHSQPQTW